MNVPRVDKSRTDGWHTNTGGGTQHLPSPSH